MDTTTNSNYSPTSIASHWLLAGSFALAYIATYSKWLFWLHFLVGFVFVAVLIFKVVRLFVSNDNSNIKSYSLSFASLVLFVKDLISGVKRDAISHNPISSFNSIALYISLAGIAASGVVFFVAKEQLFLSKDITHELKEVHEFFASAALFFIVIHICGVLSDKYIFGGKAYTWMLKTKGYSAKIESVWAFALVLFVGLAFLAYEKISTKPSLPSGEVYVLYKKECASCHFAYPANLYTKASWEKIMNTLEDHYGEDATIQTSRQQAIVQYLLANSLENGKSKPSLYFADVDIATAGSIVKSQQYKKKHKGLGKDGVTLADCSSCHGDAATGRFALVSIKKPDNKEANETK